MNREDADTFDGLVTRRRRIGAAAAAALLALALAGLCLLAWQGIAERDAALVRGPGSRPASRLIPLRPVLPTPAPQPSTSAGTPYAAAASTLLVYIVDSAAEAEFLRGMAVQFTNTEVRVFVASDPAEDASVWRNIQAEAEAHVLPGRRTAITVFDLRTR